MPAQQTRPIWQTHLLWLAGISFVMGPLFPLPAIIYLGSAFVYYAARWVMRSVRSGKIRDPILAVVSSMVGFWSGQLLAANFDFQTATPLEKLSAAVGIGSALSVVSFLLFRVTISLLLAPFRIAQGRRRRREQEYCDRERRRMSQEATDRHNEQLREQAESSRHAYSDQQRRIEARAQCELLYNQHFAEIKKRFSKKALDEFMQEYMADSQPAEIVERRSRELQRIIEEHRVAVKPIRKFHTIQELAEWFVKEQKRIQTLPIDDELREEHLVQLNMRYAELTQDMLQKMEP
jgi:hypothetical protein